MTTSTRKPQRAARSAGFTLVEVMAAATLGLIILAGVLTTVVALARSSLRLVNYATMETQTRKAFERMGIDVRGASAFAATLSGGNVTAFTLTIPTQDLGNTTYETYGYDGSAGNYTFYRVDSNDPTSTTGRTNLITNINSISILRYASDYSAITGSGSTGIRHLQISVSASRSTVGVVAATQVIRSSAFTLRNMPQ